MEEKIDMKRSNLKYMIGLLCAVTLVVGAMAGGLVSAEEDAEISELANLFSIDTVQERLESSGFIVTVEDETITAYRESPGRTMTMTIECPGGECPKPEPPEGMMGPGPGGMGPGMRKQFRFRMEDAPMDPEAFRARLESMGMDADDIEAMQAKLGEMGYNGFRGFRGCPFSDDSVE